MQVEQVNVLPDKDPLVQLLLLVINQQRLFTPKNDYDLQAEQVNVPPDIAP